MIRITTFILAIIIMGYSIYSWNDDSKQSMLILQLLLGFMLAGMGIQNVKKGEKGNKDMGLLLNMLSNSLFFKVFSLKIVVAVWYISLSIQNLFVIQ
ncbi:hypothetical protein B4147_2404 [Bacillus wiedmannii]|uniref:DUF3953 domain-containing protein n=1 Tax=Bacillus wiedmannii TaxID=1890302 RepID=A0A0G8C046_9BACI|nr:hypothetical protein [Bacillus wiedmannii]KKZ93168.1 hypothetical protein B4147_2404 [Bacillus wiedmannii]